MRRVFLPSTFRSIYEAQGLLGIGCSYGFILTGMVVGWIAYAQ